MTPSATPTASVPPTCWSAYKMTTSTRMHVLTCLLLQASTATVKYQKISLMPLSETGCERKLTED